MLRKIGIFTIATLCLISTADFVAKGQDQDRPGRNRVPDFERNIAVNYMLVDVIVTDDSGNYVRGLTKDDFEVFEEGRKKDINSIDEYQLRALPEGAESMEDLATGDLVQQQPPRNIIILMDLFYSSSYGIKRAVDVAEDFIFERIQAGDRIMVVSYFNSMQVIQPFTSDKQKVVTAMREKGLVSEGRTARVETPSGNTLPQSPNLGDQVLLDEELGERLLEEQADRLFSQKNALNYIRSLRSLASVVKEMPGRKTLIMLSEGVDFNLIDPVRLNEEQFGIDTRQNNSAEDEGGPEGPSPQRLMTLLPVYRDMIEDLNDSKVSLYTVNVGGLEAPGSASEQFGTSDGVTPGQGMRPGIESIKSRQEFLSGAAVDTGGRAYFNTNDIRSLLDSIEIDISNYYILGYRTEVDTTSSEYRNISVRVKRPGLRVLHRKGFRTPVPFEAMDRDQRDLHLVQGLEQGLQINELKVLAQTRFLSASVDDVRAAVSIQVPAETLAANKRNQFDLQVLVSNINEENKIFSSVHKQVVVNDADSADIGEKGIKIVEGIDAVFGVNKIRVAIRDNTTGKRSYFYFNQVFRNPPEDTLLVSSPVFIDAQDYKRSEDELRVEVKPQEKWNSGAPAGADLLLHPENGKIFPSIVPAFNPGDTASFFLTVNNILREDADPSEMEFVFGISEVPADRNQKRNWQVVKSLTYSKVFRQRSGLGMSFAGSFEVSGLKAGVYDFLVQVTDKESGRKNFGTTRILIRE